MNLNQKMNRRQFLGMVGVAVLCVSSIGATTASLIRLPTDGEYGHGSYGNNHYI